MQLFYKSMHMLRTYIVKKLAPETTSTKPWPKARRETGESGVLLISHHASNVWLLATFPNFEFTKLIWTEKKIIAFEEIVLGLNQ